MTSLDLLEDYEQFASFFQSLSADEDSHEPLDLDSILDSLEEDFS